MSKVRQRLYRDSIQANMSTRTWMLTLFLSWKKSSTFLITTTADKSPSKKSSILSALLICKIKHQTLSPSSKLIPMQKNLTSEFSWASSEPLNKPVNNLFSNYTKYLIPREQTASALKTFKESVTPLEKDSPQPKLIKWLIMPIRIEMEESATKNLLLLSPENSPKFDRRYTIILNKEI